MGMMFVSVGLFYSSCTQNQIVAALGGGHLLPYLSVIVAMGLFNVLGSLQNIESAEAAGDSYETRSSLMINGFGSIAAALFGSTFPTTIYIGHPGWKALGARAISCDCSWKNIATAPTNTRKKNAA